MNVDEKIKQALKDIIDLRLHIELVKVERKHGSDKGVDIELNNCTLLVNKAIKQLDFIDIEELF